MAYNIGTDRYEDLQNRRRKLKPEQNGWQITGDVANKMAEMTLSPATADSGQSSLQEASAAVEHDEETSIKSIGRTLDDAPPFSRELSFGCEGGTHEDISFKPVNTGEFNLRADAARNALVTQVPSHRTSPFSNIAVPSATGGQGHQQSLVMNIPPSLQEQRIKNTDIPTAYAEQQPSFRTVSTAVSDLSPISRGSGGIQYQGYPSQITKKSGPSSIGTFYASQLTSSLGTPCFSTEDNFISLSPNLGHHALTSQPGERQVPVWHNNFTGNGYNGSSAAAAGGCGRQISHSSSTSSLRSLINDNCMVKNLSWKILRHVALTLQCKQPSASWKDLVERYGWDYERTYLFENRPHQDGIFFSLLREPEFQDYSLEQLREDLFELPRRDILSDLNKMIYEHNSSASGGVARQNQFI